MTLPAAAWRDWAGLQAIVETLGGGKTTRAVGGAVRDTLLGLSVSDVDLATRLTPENVMARLRDANVRVVPTGLKHGTVTAVVDERPVEITTLRRDVATDGRHAQVAFSDDWREDAARRDFTINALYADTASGEVFDWFEGLGDLKARRVRFIGDPLTRISEDHLRILRFFRFHARFGIAEPDSAGLAACATRANDLMALSRERIAQELMKLLAVADPVPVIATMIAHGIFAPVIPEVDDVGPLRRCVGREAAFGLPADPIRRLAALVGPRTELAETLPGRLKLSNAQAKRLVLAARRPEGTPAALAYRYGRESAMDLLVLGDGSTQDVASLGAWQSPRLPLTGGTLIARGLEPGPVVARTLSAIESAWVEAGFPEGDALEAIVTGALSAARS